jgi:hypothetical protein
MRVLPGDTVTASISLVNDTMDTWLIEVNDVTRGGHFEKTVTYSSSRLSAEWIVERPNVNNVTSTLSNFGNVTLTNCKATIGGETGVIANFTYSQLVMVDPQDSPFVAVSPLDSFGSGFTVSYLEPASVETVHNEALLPEIVCTHASFLLPEKPVQLEASFAP